MKNKLWIIPITLLISLFVITPVLAAQYSALTGELRNDVTHTLWTWGADVEVFDCNTFATLGVQTTWTGTFSISITPSGVDRALCVNVTFHAGPNGTPGGAAKGPFLDRTSGAGGALNTGVYFTGTGPTVVGLEKFSAHSSAWIWLLAAAVVLLAAGGMYSYLRIHRKA